MKIFPENSYSLVRGRQKWEYIFPSYCTFVPPVTIFLNSVNKFGALIFFSLSLQHEKRNYPNYHQSCIVRTWFDSCLFWCLSHDIMQYVSQCRC
nr:MAG TPA: hypothetical protein [Microviridae sp.]